MKKIYLVRLIVGLLGGVLPSVAWQLMKQVHSPWWIENTFSSPFIIIPIAVVLIIVLFRLLTWRVCLGMCVVNVVFAFALNNPLSSSAKDCDNPITFFQFNMKFTEDKAQLTQLIEHVKVKDYHLIALQGVSVKVKDFLVNELSPNFPYFVNSDSKHHVHSDQLLFSRYAFEQVDYFKHQYSAYLITSQWQLPAGEVKLLTMHPPSPRSESLWKIRNKTLYQLAYVLEQSPLASALVIGDLNISHHSTRIKSLVAGMDTVFVNSWPKTPFTSASMGLTIDHLWVSNPAKVCQRERVDLFRWSDHYAVQSQVSFPLTPAPTITAKSGD